VLRTHLPYPNPNPNPNPAKVALTVLLFNMEAKGTSQIRQGLIPLALASEHLAAMEAAAAAAAAAAPAARAEALLAQILQANAEHVKLGHAYVEMGKHIQQLRHELDDLLKPQKMSTIAPLPGPPQKRRALAQRQELPRPAAPILPSSQSPSHEEEAVDVEVEQTRMRNTILAGFCSM